MAKKYVTTEMWRVQTPGADGEFLGMVERRVTQYSTKYLAMSPIGAPVTGGEGWDADPGLSGYLTDDDAAEALYWHHAGLDDPISRELKQVATAVYAEYLASKTTGTQVTVDDVAAAIASAMWPGTEDKPIRDRFVSMCTEAPWLKEHEPR